MISDISRTPMDKEDLRSLVCRFFDAAEAGDLETIESLYAEDVIVWHNNDNIGQTKSQNLAALAGAFERLVKRRYADRVLNLFDGGFVQQHRFIAIRQDGEIIEMPVVVVGKISNGQIHRLDEYFETQALAMLRAPSRNREHESVETNTR
jgi:ketosteroid isomerase-like protein